MAVSDMVERAAKAAQHATAVTDEGELASLDAFLIEQYSGENSIVLTMRAAARAALLAAFDPEDEDLCNDIGCEIAGGSGDEAAAVEMAFHVKLVLRELRNRIAQGEPQP